jgi:hypothetical protein
MLFGIVSFGWGNQGNGVKMGQFCIYEIEENGSES